jgi:hypothetical protein
MALGECRRGIDAARERGIGTATAVEQDHGGTRGAAARREEIADQRRLAVGAREADGLGLPAGGRRGATAGKDARQEEPEPERPGDPRTHG